MSTKQVYVLMYASKGCVALVLCHFCVPGFNACLSVPALVTHFQRCIEEFKLLQIPRKHSFAWPGKAHSLLSVVLCMTEAQGNVMLQRRCCSQC